MSDATVTSLHDKNSVDPVGDVMRREKDRFLSLQINAESRAHSARLEIADLQEQIRIKQQVEAEALAECDEHHRKVVKLHDKLTAHEREMIAPGVA